MKSHYDYPPLLTSLAVRGAEQAIEFYRDAFGATERYRLTDSSTGQIGHVELDLNGSVIMLSEENPQWNKAPQTLGGTSVKFCLMVENADEAFARALAAGGTELMPVSDQFYGFRSGSLQDPFGHEWMVQQPIEDVSPEEMQRRWDAMVEAGGPS